MAQGPYKYNGIEASNIGLGQLGFHEISDDKTHHVGVEGTNTSTNIYHPDRKNWVYLRNITKPAGSLIEILNEESSPGLGDPLNYSMWVITDPGDIEIKLTSHLGDSTTVFLPQSGVIDGCFKTIQVVGTLNPAGTETPTVLAYRG